MSVRHVIVGVTVAVTALLGLAPGASAAWLEVTSETSGQSDTPTFAGTGTAGNTVEVTVDGALSCSSLVAADDTWSCTSTVVMLRGQTAQVIATDTTTTEAYYTSYVAWTPPPTVTIDDPADGSTIGSFWSISGSGPENTDLQASLDGGSTADFSCGDYWGPLGPDGWMCWYNRPTPAPGPHTVTLVSTDTWGQQGEATAQFTMAAPPTSPVVVSPASGLQFPVQNLLVTGTAEPGMTITVIGEHSGSPLCSDKPCFPDGGQPLSTVVDPSGSWSLTIPAWRIALLPPTADQEYEGFLFEATNEYDQRAYSAPFDIYRQPSSATPTPTPTPTPTHSTAASSAAANQGHATPALAQTGAPIGWTVGLGLLLVTLGALAVAAARRRSTGAH